MKLEIITNGERDYRGIEMPDGSTFSTGDPVADFSYALAHLVQKGLRVTTPAGDIAASPTDALTERVKAWVGLALTKAKVKPVPETDTFIATLPPFRRFVVTAFAESAALIELRHILEEFAKGELCAGRELHTWETKVPEITPQMKRLVRISNLKHELRTRAAQWGGERQLLPAHAVERCLADIDALVTRHAMQIQGVTPPGCQS
ncbi:MAG: hypothetical protein HS117_19320 [Verrucomicrobiaceae bacterium]|nr:hypothetical protein [Verrucomicrobiaceae bacterium]